MISKRMNFCWCAPKMSWLRHLSPVSFKLFNPQWDVIVHSIEYTPKTLSWEDPLQQDFVIYDGPDYLNILTKYGIKVVHHAIPDGWKEFSPVHLTDIFRWEILYKDGGFYSDTDIIYFRPISVFISDQELGSINAVVCFNDRGHCLIGFLGSSVGNPYYENIYNSAHSSFDIKSYQSVGAECILKILDPNKTCNLKHILGVLESNFGAFKNVEMHVVYPFTYEDIESLYNEKFDENRIAKSIGIHWFGGIPLSSRFNIRINQTNIHKQQNILSNIIARHIITKI